MQGKAISVIGAYNKDLRENEAFLGFTKHFLSKGVNVPDIIAEDLSRNIYILSDLGDETLYSYRCKFNEFTP